MSMEIIPVEPVAPITLFGTDNPQEIVASATAKANALAGVIKAKKLFTNISGKEYVRVEGWTLLGSMLGVFPICVWTRPLENGWEACVEARTLGGQVVGSSEAQCTRSENTWRTRDDYALRSMAQTRATAKALRLPLGFVMALAGYEATPAEEMDFSTPSRAPETPVRASNGAVTPPAPTSLAPEQLSGFGTPEGKVNAREFMTYFESQGLKTDDLKPLLPSAATLGAALSAWLAADPDRTLLDLLTLAKPMEEPVAT